MKKDDCEVDKYISIVDDESCCLIDIQIAVKPERKETFFKWGLFKGVRVGMSGA